MGSVLSGALAASLVVFVMRQDEDQRILGDVVSAHLRSLQGDHLIDVQSTDQHTVKPWFNGRLDRRAAGRRSDRAGLHPDRRPARLSRWPAGRRHRLQAARPCHQSVRRAGAGGSGSERRATIEQVQGFNIWRWTRSDLGFWAVSDINAEELQEFGDKLEAAVRNGA